MAVERGDATWIEVWSGAAWVKPAGQLDGAPSRDKDAIDTTSKDTGGWKENIDGFKGWSLPMTCLFDETDSGYVIIKAAFEGNTRLNVRYFDGTNFQVGYSRSTALEITGPHAEVKQYTATFTGDGVLT